MSAPIRRLLTLLGILASLLVAEASQPHDFRWLVPIAGDLQPGVPVGVPLTRQVIAATHGLADLRLFDAHGQEIPYVIYEYRGQHTPPFTFAFRLQAYSRDASGETIVLERPEESGAFWEISLVTSARDFHKSVQVQTSTDLVTWQEVATDTVFDFSSRLNLRKTAITVPETTARYARLLLQEVPPATAHGPDMTLQYEGLHVRLNNANVPGFRLEQILGRGGATAPASTIYDRATFPQPQVTPDKEGNTVVDLGGVHCPITEVTMHVDNPYYYRQVELWAADKDSPEAYRQIASDVLYKIPGMAVAKNTLSVQQPQQHYVRLKVRNGDNPPLRIRQVDIAWVPQHLYFIPEAAQHYTLYYGSESQRPLVYELRHLLTAQQAARLVSPAVSLGEPQPNPDYRPPPSQGRQHTFENALLLVVIVLLTGGLSVWLYRLLRAIPSS